MDIGQQRVGDRFMADLDRMVTAVSWGVAIAHDPKGRTVQKWNRIRARSGRASSALSGADLENAVFALAAADPSLVKIQQGAV